MLLLPHVSLLLPCGFDDDKDIRRPYEGKTNFPVTTFLSINNLYLNWIGEPWGLFGDMPDKIGIGMELEWNFFFR
jgi:hypothetical protein